MINIGIIGGGASGMTAAIEAAKNGAKVTIIEQKERLGKKILSTGNGRCNLTNEYMELDCFRGENLLFVQKVLNNIGYKEICDFFEEMGVFTKSKNGYIYPRSEQALTVVESFEMELNRLGVKCLMNTKVNSLKRAKKGFTVFVTEKIAKEFPSEKNSLKKGRKKKTVEYFEKDSAFSFDKVILATGGKAASVLGSDGSGYNLAKSFGHSLTPVVPALVQLRSDDDCFKQLSGIRTEGTVHLYVNNERKASDTGEIQLTDYGISGIPVFQVSRYASLGLYEGKEVMTSIDFVPYCSENEFKGILLERSKKWESNSVEEFLRGIFNKKMIPVLLKKMNTNGNELIRNISKDWYTEFAHFCKNYKIEISGTNSFEQAQICAGGVRTTEVNNATMESEYVEGLYLTGELLDVDGICGGYNLQWAWSTGILAGRSASCS